MKFVEEAVELVSYLFCLISGITLLLAALALAGVILGSTDIAALGAFWGLFFLAMSVLTPIVAVIFMIFKPSPRSLKNFEAFLFSWLMLLAGAVLFWIGSLINNFPKITKGSVFRSAYDAAVPHWVVYLDFVLTIIFLCLLVWTLWRTIKKNNKGRLDIYLSWISALVVLVLAGLGMRSILTIFAPLDVPHAMVLVGFCTYVRWRSQKMETAEAIP